MFRKLLCLFLFATLLCAALPTGAALNVLAKNVQTDASAKTAGTAKKTEAAVQQPAPPAMNVKSALLMEDSTGRMLYQQNPHEKLPLASITKVMTELLVMEALEKGELKLSQKITCSAHAASMGGSDIWIEPNEVMTVNDLLKAMAIYSANDAAMALAETVGGTEQAFVNRMNERAGELGMKDTHFVNPTGLDADGHYSSAYDIALMSRALIRHKEIFKYCTIWMDTLRSGKTTLYNTNKLIRFYLGCNGLKTGSTGKAGYCISATALRDGMQLIAVTMGSPSDKERFAAARHLLDYGFTNWAVVRPKPVQNGLSVRVLHGTEERVTAKASGTSSIVVSRLKQKKIEQKVSLVADVMAPVEKGQVLGQIAFYLDGEKIGFVPLTAEKSVGQMTFFRAFAEFFSALVAG